MTICACIFYELHLNFGTKTEKLTNKLLESVYAKGKYKSLASPTALSNTPFLLLRIKL